MLFGGWAIKVDFQSNHGPSLCMHAQSDLREQSPCKKPTHLKYLNVSAISYCHWFLARETCRRMMRIGCFNVALPCWCPLQKIGVFEAVVITSPHLKICLVRLARSHDFILISTWECAASFIYVWYIYGILAFWLIWVGRCYQAYRFRFCYVGTLRMALMLFPELLDSQLHQNEGFNDAALKWLKTFGLQGCLDIWW